MTGETAPATRDKAQVEAEMEARVEASRFVNAAKAIGATVTMESEWARTGQVRFSHGGTAYFTVGNLDVNLRSSSQVARDKHYSAFFLDKAGYPVIPGQTFFSPSCIAERPAMQARNLDRGMEAACKYAESIGYPVIVKPNDGSQGIGVSLARNEGELRKALETVFEKHEVALVQERVKGKDYRVLVFEGKIVAAYERIPLNIIGDGASSIRSLLEKKIKAFADSGRKIKEVLVDPRIQAKIAEQNLTMESVPNAGDQIFLLDNANLSSGGESLDVTSAISPAFADIAKGISDTMALRLCGVDLMIEGDISGQPDTYWVVEVNSTPGIGHFARSGSEQENKVNDIYVEVLKSLEETSRPK